MSTKPKGWGRLVTTPYGDARVNAMGQVLWAEWEVWRHATEMVEAGTWTSRPSAHRTRQRTEFFVVDVPAA